jgi:hypothetical protein
MAHLTLDYSKNPTKHWVCQYGEGGLHVVDAKQLPLVVAMVPFKPPEVGPDGEELGDCQEYYYFVVEKPGLDACGMREGSEEEAGEE